MRPLTSRSGVRASLGAILRSAGSWNLRPTQALLHPAWQMLGAWSRMNQHSQTAIVEQHAQDQRMPDRRGCGRFVFGCNARGVPVGIGGGGGCAAEFVSHGCVSRRQSLVSRNSCREMAAALDMSKTPQRACVAESDPGVFLSFAHATQTSSCTRLFSLVGRAPAQ